jgi:hypothetical protein
MFLGYGDTSSVIGNKSQDMNLALSTKTLTQHNCTVSADRYFDFLYDGLNIVFGQNWFMSVEETLVDPEKQKHT